MVNFERERFMERESEVIQSLKDLRGNLHGHSELSMIPAETRKLHSIEQVAEQAAKIGTRTEKDKPGIEYLAFTEHPETTNKPYQGLDEKSGQRILKQKERIDAFNKEGRYPGLTLLQGVEADIYQDGKLNISNDVLKKLDIVIASLHPESGIETHQEKIATYEKVIQNPYVDIIGHPDSKWHELEFKLTEEEWSELITTAKKYDKAIEINVNQIEAYHPQSLKMMAESGVKVSFGSDTHELDTIMKDQKLGTDWKKFAKVVLLMKEAGLKKSQILNCLSLEELRKWREERIAKFEVE